jgi:uncharacterized protein YqjF (DUF2071 family)
MALDPITPTAPPGAALRLLGRPVFGQSWTRLTYLHWPYDPAVIARLLPPGIEPDLFDGAAWAGLIPFHLRRVSILGTPSLPWVSSFLETNVRLYSAGPDGRRGVVFRSLDADRLLPVLAARSSYRLPYMWARMRMHTDGDVVTYSGRRRWPGPRTAHWNVKVRVGDVVEASPLDHFLTARWGLHGVWGSGAVWAPVEHEQWPLRSAELLELDESLLAAAGLPEPEGPPRVLWSEGVRVDIGPPRRVGRPPG